VSDREVTCARSRYPYRRPRKLAPFRVTVSSLDKPYPPHRWRRRRRPHAAAAAHTTRSEVEAIDSLHDGRDRRRLQRRWGRLLRSDGFTIVVASEIGIQFRSKDGLEADEGDEERGRREEK
jgi:hypothetical protein